MTRRRIQIGDRWVGEGQPCFVVAEISANHNQSYERAIAILESAKQAGADAVKIQTYTADTLTIDSDREYFKIGDGGLWSGKTLFELYKEAYTPWDWQPKLKAAAEKLGLYFFSTPFDDTAVDFLEALNVCAYKVASFELVDQGLLKKIAATGKPVILSTGMASLMEIDEAVKTLRENGTTQLVLLKCTSAYPAPPAEMNLRTIPHLTATFDVVAGLSDHTLGSSVAVAAVALGAAVVEKHFTLSRSDVGPDSPFSMEPEEFASMVRDIRQVEQALGEVSYVPAAEESKNRCFRRSLFVVRDIKQGERFTHENVRSIRPGYGLSPRFLNDIVGRRAATDIVRGTPLNWDVICGPKET